jgi:hypothetical protein
LRSSNAVAAWNWRPTIEFIGVEGIIDDETWELMTSNLGTKVGADLAGRMAAAIQRKLQRMGPGERMLADLSITSSRQELSKQSSVF